MGNQHLNGYLLCVFLGALCGGCIMYVPDSWTSSARENRAETTIPSIIPGKTTKAEVYLLLGVPDGYSWNQLVYRWEKLKFLLLIPGGYQILAVKVDKKSRLILTFDEHGVVTEQKVEAGLDWNAGISGSSLKEP